MLRHRTRFAAAAGLSAVALAGSSAFLSASATTVVRTDIPVSVDRPYVKANGRAPTAGDAITRCGSNRRQQNEPSAAINARTPNVVVSGSNDYCTTELAGGTWTGFYRSTDSGGTWTNSLLPGYPTDQSPEGLASPLHQRGITNAGDPVQAWDTSGRLFYMGNAFNRAAPQNGSVWIATYDQDAARYVRTVIVGSGTPAVNGRFNDKTSLEVDRGVSSLYNGNVYGAWSVFQGRAGNNEILFTRSTDHGATFSHPTKISTGSKNVQFADIAVTSNGTVYVAYRQFETDRGQQESSIQYVVSTDGGRSFSKPRTAATFEPFDAADTARNGAAAEEAHEQAYENSDGPESEAGEESVGDSRDCGSGPFACRSGFVFFRHDSQPRITADPKAADQRVYLVYDATVRGTEQASQTTYNTADPVGTTLRVGQGGIYFTSLSGSTWSTPRRLAPTARGHQFFPDINADGGVLHAVWHDSRNDPAYSVQYPPGNDGAVRDRGGFATATLGLDTYGASSRDGGTSWATARLSRTSQMPNYEMFGDRQVPFHGDYNYVSSVGAQAYSTWTDTRQVAPGDDPRYVGGEGFDVLQCRAPQPGGGYGPDACPNAGGLDQDIYGAATTG
ncbi:sialidase family protein [Luteipulveratus sp. YIM 133132]|uniref:sialidase family protein n=1 Tax=Luteipulveratus flavus TaxID=3031728 RepID=UPI0023B0E1A9|nr:sialidase family protein [Luteipulveratus sp. YIM 133132]MDE9366292.1 sialidase family protein [Luteipulveratus sp. YIM 133132]